MSSEDKQLVEWLRKAAKPSEFRRRNPTLGDSAMALRHGLEGKLFIDAATRLESLCGEVERLKEALESAVPVLQDWRKIVWDSHVILAEWHPKKGALDEEGEKHIQPFDSALAKARAALSPDDGEEEPASPENSLP